jgi:hypothetical protein
VFCLWGPKYVLYRYLPTGIPISAYEVKQILKHKIDLDGIHLKVLWRGWPPSYATYEPLKNLIGLPIAIKYAQRNNLQYFK